MRLQDEEYESLVIHESVVSCWCVGGIAERVWEYGIVPLHVKIAGSGSM